MQLQQSPNFSVNATICRLRSAKSQNVVLGEVVC